MNLFNNKLHLLLIQASNELELTPLFFLKILMYSMESCFFVNKDISEICDAAGYLLVNKYFTSQQQIIMFMSQKKLEKTIPYMIQLHPLSCAARVSSIKYHTLH